jgi:nucleoid DNA-binding protein
MADGKKQMNKSQLAGALAESSGLSKAQVNSVLAALDDTIKKELGKKGPGVFVLPGLLKMQLRKVPAKKAQEVRNPFTGQMMMSKPKAAYNKVTARPLKALKDSVA